MICPTKDSMTKTTFCAYVPATVVGLLSFLKCIAIRYERSGRTQLYWDCPVLHLTFPNACMDCCASKRLRASPPDASTQSVVVVAHAQEG